MQFFNKRRFKGMNLVDLDCEAVIEVLSDRFTVEEIEGMCEGTTVATPTLTVECRSLLARLAAAPASTMSMRKALMSQVEFDDHNVFDPAVHEDYDTVHILGHHL
jgi:hypothetical protein